MIVSQVRLAAFSLFLLSISWNALAWEVSRNEVLRYAYLANTPYFFSSDLDSSINYNKEREILDQLRPSEDPLVELNSPAVQHLELLAESPAPVVVAIARNSNSDGDSSGDLIFALRGSSTLGDYLADVALFEIYGKARMRNSIHFNRESLQRFASPNWLETLFECLPDCSPRPTAEGTFSDASPAEPQALLLAQNNNSLTTYLSALSFTQYFSNVPQNFVNSILKQRLIDQYLKPIGGIIGQFLQGELLKTTLKSLKINKIKRIIFVGHSLGGLMARILALNYSNRIAGFNIQPLSEDLPEHAESAGFNVPGFNRDDYQKLFALMTQGEPFQRDPLPFIETQHLTIGHKQDLVLAMGNIREKPGQNGPELALEPDGSSFVISLSQEWFENLSHPDTPRTALSKRIELPIRRQNTCKRAQFCARWTGETLYQWATCGFQRAAGIGPVNIKPHDIFELIHSLERITDPTLEFTIYPFLGGSRAAPVHAT